MKTHIKALLVTMGVFLILVGLYYAFVASKSPTATDIPAVNETLSLPTADMVSIDGKKINLKDFADKVVIFNFWASWCSPCIEEVPSLVSLIKEDPNIIIIAVSGDQNKDDIHAFLKSFPGFNKPPSYIIQENAKVLMEHFKVDKLPESFIFNAKGEMVKKITGTINWHTKESLEYFKSLRM